MRRRLPVAILICALLALGVAACGNERTKPPDVTKIAKAVDWVPVEDYASQGIRFERPAGWLLQAGTQPNLLATVSAGEVTVAVWRYARDQELPRTAEDLERAKDVLVAASKARDATLKVEQAKGTRAAKSPAVVIVGDETVAGQPRKVRSTHVYAHGAEFVIDAMAPPAVFAQIEEQVFRTFVRSVKLSAPTG